jgi:hypothetical protein
MTVQANPSRSYLDKQGSGMNGIGERLHSTGIADGQTRKKETFKVYRPCEFACCTSALKYCRFRDACQS